jgi:phosphatidylserine/phosphatidylglycerophosphate/cardiolipin synthase-like enzyme
VKRLSFFISLVLLSSSVMHGMEKGKVPAKIGLSKMKEIADSLEQEGSSLSSPMNITTELATTPYMRCYFTPNIKDAFLNCIANEQEAVRGAWYRFTLYDAARAIVKGIQEKNIAAKIVISSDHREKDFCSALKLILEHGGTVLEIFQQRFAHTQGYYQHMHHKFMIFGRNIENKKLLWTGSWNATGQASNKNCENVMIVDDQEAVANYEKEMVELEKLSTALTVQRCVSQKDHEPNALARDMNGIPRLVSVPPLSSIPPLSTISIPPLNTIPRLEDVLANNNK